jgi:hypothetical protein
MRDAHSTSYITSKSLPSSFYSQNEHSLLSHYRYGISPATPGQSEQVSSHQQHHHQQQLQLQHHQQQQMLTHNASSSSNVPTKSLTQHEFNQRQQMHHYQQQQQRHQLSAPEKLLPKKSFQPITIDLSKHQSPTDTPTSPTNSSALSAPPPTHPYSSLPAHHMQYIPKHWIWNTNLFYSRSLSDPALNHAYFSYANLYSGLPESAKSESSTANSPIHLSDNNSEDSLDNEDVKVRPLKCFVYQ